MSINVEERTSIAASHSQLSLRRIDECDLAELQRIRSAAFAPIFAGFREMVGEDIAAIAFETADAEQERQLNEICDDDSGHHVFAAVVDSRILGFVTFTVDRASRTGEIGLNAIDPVHRGQGIGTWMYEEALGRMKALGTRMVEVGTGGDAAHAPARRAYEKAGFRAGVPSLHLYRML